MLGNALIGLREGLEASLVVSILVAFLVRTDRRAELLRVWFGVVLAVLVSAGVTLGLTLTEQALTFRAQEALGGSLSILAVGFVTWMIFWMRRNARALSVDLQGKLDAAIEMGPSAVVVMSALAVGREGLETAVFFFAAARAAGRTAQPLIGFLLGIAVAVLVAWLLYRGAMKIDLGRFFTVTGFFLIFVAAGILAYGLHDLQEAAILPGLRALAFDVSAAVPPDSWYGVLLKGVLNFSPQTTVLQAVAWVLYVGLVLSLFLRPAWLAAVAAVALAGCTSTAPPPAAAPGAAGAAGPITVQAADGACQVGAAEAPAGTLTFSITNAGTTVTEFYLYGTGDRIMGEVENIGPGLTRELIVEVPDGGTYTTACKPGMIGDGIRSPFTVTGSAARSTDTDARLAEATTGYQRYLTSQVDALVTRTREFSAAVKAGHVDQAKALYPVARTYYERVEPVASSFGDLDPRLDRREDDERGPGVPWTGFHRLEKDLWVDGLQPDAGAVADQLVTDVEDLQTRVAGLTPSPVDLANGAKGLLDEVATVKITGEEDRYSHTDLWDFTANVEGSQAAVAALRPVIDEKDATLGPVLDERFAAVDALLQGYRDGDGFRIYTRLNPDDIKKMTVAVDALSEPVSQVAGVVSS